MDHQGLDEGEDDRRCSERPLEEVARLSDSNRAFGHNSKLPLLALGLIPEEDCQAVGVDCVYQDDDESILKDEFKSICDVVSSSREARRVRSDCHDYIKGDEEGIVEE